MEEGEIMTTEVENTVEEPVVEQTVAPIEPEKLYAALEECII